MFIFLETELRSIYRFSDVPEEQEVLHVAENETEEKIYDDLCSLKRSTGSQVHDIMGSLETSPCDSVILPQLHFKVTRY